MLTDAAHQAMWGDLFEIAVKRGCLGVLQDRGWLKEGFGHLRPWRTLRITALHDHVLAQTGAVDERERAWLRSSLDHLLLAGWGLGWTVMRELLRRLGPQAGAQVGSQGAHLTGVFCPLTLPDRRRAVAPDGAARVAALWQAFALPGPPDLAWAGHGEPANADLLLTLDAGGRRHLVCVEFSMHAPPAALDFSEEAAHLAELERFVRRIDSRGVFTRIAAEVTGDRFVLGDGVISHLNALTTPDKPLFKLCQGSAYASRFLHQMSRRGGVIDPVFAHVIAVTNAGIEAFRAVFDADGASPHSDPRRRLMQALGAAYRRYRSIPDDDAPALDREIQAVREQICRSLPPALRDPLEAAFAVPAARQIDVRLHEPIQGFVSPASPVLRHEALGWLDGASAEVANLLGGPPRERVDAQLSATLGRSSVVTLRDAHQAALLASLSAAPAGRVSVLAAEGHPGIGKTTAVLEYLRRLDSSDRGYLFFYASPRTIINSEVTRSVAQDARGEPSGVLALTTNARLIGAASANARHDHGRDGARSPYVDAAVVADGVANLCVPDGSIRFLTPDEAQQLDEDYASSRFRKRTWEERVDVVETRHAPGVLFTLARAVRGCLAANPALNRLVMTGAIQGYRLADGGVSTVDRLSAIFQSPADTPRGLRERGAFAQRISTVVVMVDEIAGDGAGAPLVHALAAWLEREFIAPFSGSDRPSPYRVILVLSDASLANDAVLASYLASPESAPEKVIVSGGAGSSPLRLAARPLLLGGRMRPALHLMADGFPASALDVEYHLKLSPVRLPPRDPGGAVVTPRAAIREQHGEATVHAAVAELYAALARLPANQQVILFAQDKALLRDIRQALVNPASLDMRGAAPPVETYGQRLSGDQIGLLDSSISERERRRLTAPAVRDALRVFLMTSSGARGVSFPHAATLIALVPRFAVESGFMEIAQLIFRGRGRARDPETGALWDGDALHRRIVLILQDFVIEDETLDDRQWLRRTVDLVSALVLLRATVLTRITGDAGIPGQRAAVVPVGRVGQEAIDTSLAQSIGAFLHEGAVFLRDPVLPHHRTRVDRAVRTAEGVFRELRLIGTPLHPARRSLASPDALRETMEVACGAALPLLWNGQYPAIPEAAYSLGPIWLESWADMRAEEVFQFQAAQERLQERLKGLLGNCRAIERDRDLPGALRRAARDMVDILQRSDELLGLAFVTRRALGSERIWVCLPVDYERFCTLPPGEEHLGRTFRLAEPEHWLEDLERAASAYCAPTARFPVLPYFQGRPFFAMTTYGDPTGFARTFDDRYFMASSELNLLNTLLFVTPSGAAEPA